MCSYGSCAGQQQANLCGSGRFWTVLFGEWGHLWRQVSEKPDSEGWYDYLGNPSPPYALCQFKQGHDGQVWVGYGNDFHPLMNVANLKWRYTGIAKQERGL